MDNNDFDINDNFYSSVYEDSCLCFKGKSVDVRINDDQPEIRVDLLLEEKKIFKILGQVLDNEQNPVNNAVITLLKPKRIEGENQYMIMATVLSDCEGFYQFEVNELGEGLNYKIMVGKN